MADKLRLISPNFSDVFEPNIEIGKFPDGDSHVRIPLINDCKGREVIIFHRLYPEQNTSMVILLLILDSVKTAGAKKITVIAPYLPYSRQDKKKLNGEVASAFVICNLLHRAGCNELVTFDCHFLNQEGVVKFGELTINNLSLGSELVALAKKDGFNGEPCEVISPDMGSNYLVSGHGGKSFNKARHDYQDNKIGFREVNEMSGEFDVKGKNILILDDMISTGGTMIKAMDKLKAGGAKKICCAATHGLFLYNCIYKIKNFTDCVYSTDTITNDYAKVSIKDKLGQLLGKTIN